MPGQLSGRPLRTASGAVDISKDQMGWANIKGVYLMCRAILPGMIERGVGDIINVASVTGKRPLPRRTPLEYTLMPSAHRHQHIARVQNRSLTQSC